MNLNSNIFLSPSQQSHASLHLTMTEHHWNADSQIYRIVQDKLITPLSCIRGGSIINTIVLAFYDAVRDAKINYDDERVREITAILSNFSWIVSSDSKTHHGFRSEPDVTKLVSSVVCLLHPPPPSPEHSHHSSNPLMDLVKPFQINEEDGGLASVLNHWSITNCDSLSRFHFCRICEVIFTDEIPGSTLVYLPATADRHFVTRVFSRHRCRTCPFRDFLLPELGLQELNALSKFLSYARHDKEVIRMAIGWKTLSQWLSDHKRDSLNGKPILSGIFAGKVIARGSLNSSFVRRAFDASISHFWE